MRSMWNTKPKNMLLRSKLIHQFKVVNLSSALPYTLRLCRISSRRLFSSENYRHVLTNFYTCIDNNSFVTFKTKNSFKPFQ